MDELKEAEQSQLNGKSILYWVLNEPDQIEKMFENCLCEITAKKIMLVYKTHILNKKVKEKRERSKEKFNIQD